jgi:competence protein ComEA
MTELMRRLILWVMMLVFTIVIYMKSHGPENKGSPVAFFNNQKAGITVKVAGNVGFPGIYFVPEKATVNTVINMAVPAGKQKQVAHSLADAQLKNGDVVEILRYSGQHINIIIKNMRAQDRIMLGIPLELNRMDVDDWDCLPGIGPVLAARIVNDRQLNGDFSCVSDLKRIQGIGETKVQQLEGYFKNM